MSLLDETELLPKMKDNRSKHWNRFVTMLASVVVFVTVYALILPAITMETSKDSETTSAEITTTVITEEDDTTISDETTIIDEIELESTSTESESIEIAIKNISEDEELDIIPLGLEGASTYQVVDVVEQTNEVPADYLHTYSKVIDSSDLTTDDSYLIVSPSSNVAMYQTSSSTTITGSTITISNDKLTYVSDTEDDSGLSHWKLVSIGTENQYYIANEDESVWLRYNNRNLRTTTTQSQRTAFTASWSSNGQLTLHCTQSNRSYYIYYQSGSFRLTTSTSTAGYLGLYKYESSNVNSTTTSSGLILMEKLLSLQI